MTDTVVTTCDVYKYNIHTYSTKFKHWALHLANSSVNNMDEEVNETEP